MLLFRITMIKLSRSSLSLSLFIIFNNFTILTLSIEFLSMYSKELLLPFSRRKLILQRNRNVDH